MVQNNGFLFSYVYKVLLHIKKLSTYVVEVFFSPNVCHLIRNLVLFCQCIFDALSNKQKTVLC